MKSFLIALLLLPSIALAGSATQPAPLQLDATLTTTHTKDAAGKPVTKFDFELALINTGDAPVTIITEHLDYKSTANKLAVGYVHDLQVDGHQVIPSLPTLGPVTLRPGEAAIIQLDPKSLEMYKDGPLSIAYIVGKAWGERLGIWSGECVGDVKMVAGD